MAQPYVGEIRMFAGNFAPAGWAFCNGATLPISENETLFQLIGTTYGGDGEETFNLPDLQGRLPVHMGTGTTGTTYTIGENGGVENVTLTTGQIPNHNHAFLVSTGPGNSADPTNQVFGQAGSGADIYYEDAAVAALSGNSIQPAGGSQPHENMQPFLCISFIISLYGIFPSPT
ncbi:phage tail protein [Deinococcus roseus]|uniref:Tail Collar domain-containing protein n=1 Tax=Deinococcus roseus TaxID=392414 RepID=A0ABQ2D5Z3_9DEIO|nr:tail fiber protein [Deinococcus roseus]GGJ45041.1 tail Collar domain-containing protein [Deinococcus roseus]